MKKIQELLEVKKRLRLSMQTLDREASFDTEDGRKYTRVLVKLVMIEMQMEAIEKKKAAHQ